MEREAVRNFRRILDNNALSEYTIGAVLGLELTQEEIDLAETRAFEILQDLGMLPTKNDIVLCEKETVNGFCGKICQVSEEPARSRIGFRWRCKGSRQDHGISKTNPMAGILFENAHVNYSKFLKILYGVFKERSLDEIHKLVGGSATTIVDYYSLIKEALAVCGWHDQGRVGGPGDVVEIDEVLLIKRKYNRGRIPIGNYWVFGGVSRFSKKRFAMRVPDRSRITLLGEIVDSIAPGSIICSDGWAAYEGIMPTAYINNNQPGIRDNQGNLVYQDHLVVIHDRQFVQPPRNEPPLWRNDILPECRDHLFVGPLPGPIELGTLLPFRIHTQTVERQWRELRDSVESSSNLEIVDRKIGYWLYRENTLRSRLGTHAENFRRFISDINRVYPGPNIRPIRANRPGQRLYPNQQEVEICDCDDCLNLE